MQTYLSTTPTPRAKTSAQARRNDSRRRQATRAKYWVDVAGVIHMRMCEVPVTYYDLRTGPSLARPDRGSIA